MVIYSGKRYARGYKREEKLSPQDWFEKKIKFASQDVSPILGNFKIKYSPHYKKLLQLVERTLTRKMFAKWASQSGKSLFGIGVGSWKLDQNPAIVIYAIPTADKISEVLTLKINPVLKSMPDLWKKFEEYSEQEKFRTKDAMKRVPGGALAIKSALSEKDRKSLTSPMVIMDEIGEFEEGAVKEYSERTKSFSRFHPLVLGLSTIVDPLDEICTNHDLCEVKIEWHFICQECKKNFYPDGEYIKTTSKEEFSKSKNIDIKEIRASEYMNLAKKEGHIECPHCKHKIFDEERVEMIFNEGMDWFQKHEDGSYTLFKVEDLTTETSFGIDMNSLGSYFAPLPDIIQEMIEAEDNDVLMDKFSRGWLNKFHKIKHIEKQESDMLLLGNNLREWIIPKDTLAVYLTIDNQIDYLFAQVTAIQYGMKVHIVYFGRIESWGDAEHLWEICQNLQGEDGETYMASYMGIDRRGYNEGQISRTEEADYFVDYMQNKWGQDRIYAMEGHPELRGGQAFRVKNQKDLSNQRYKLDIKIIEFSNVYIKHKLFKWIDRTIAYNKAQEGEEARGYDDKMVFINQDNIERDRDGVVDTSITRMLTAEVWGYEIDKKTGKKSSRESYFKIRPRNDAIDTSDMALVFAEKDKLSMAQKPEAINITESLNRLGTF